MVGFVVVLLILVALTSYYFIHNKARQRKSLQMLRDAWGKSKDQHYNFDLIKKYAATQQGACRLTEQSLFDIDFYNVFQFVDRTTSRVGQQLLFSKMVHPQLSETLLDDFEKLVDRYSHDLKMRENTQLSLLRLNDASAYQIASLLEDKQIARPSWFNWLYASNFSILLIAAFSIVYPILLFALLIPLNINLFVHYWNKMNLMPYLSSLPQLDILIEVSDQLMKKDKLEDSRINQDIEMLRPFQKKMLLVSFGSSGGLRDELGMVATYLFEFIKAAF